MGGVVKIIKINTCKECPHLQLQESFDYRCTYFRHIISEETIDNNETSVQCQLENENTTTPVNYKKRGSDDVYTFIGTAINDVTKIYGMLLKNNTTGLVFFVEEKDFNHVHHCIGKRHSMCYKTWTKMEN
jgi:hypothetical protein